MFANKYLLLISVVYSLVIGVQSNALSMVKTNNIKSFLLKQVKDPHIIVSSLLHSPFLYQIINKTQHLDIQEYFTYSGDIKHLLINWGLLALNSSYLLKILSIKNSLRAFFLFSGLQSLCWYYSNVTGVSIVWCAFYGIIIEKMINKKLNKKKLNKNNKFIINIFNSIGIMFYCYKLSYSSPTNLAHILSVVLGFVYAKKFIK